MWIMTRFKRMCKVVVFCWPECVGNILDQHEKHQARQAWGFSTRPLRKLLWLSKRVWEYLSEGTYVERI